MLRVIGKSADPRLKAALFWPNANLLTAGLVSRVPAFPKILHQLHDRIRTNVRPSSSSIRKACRCGRSPGGSV